MIGRDATQTIFIRVVTLMHGSVQIQNLYSRIGSSGRHASMNSLQVLFNSIISQYDVSAIRNARGNHVDP